MFPVASIRMTVREMVIRTTPPVGTKNQIKTVQTPNRCSYLLAIRKKL
jgi:hypothetical protein